MASSSFDQEFKVTDPKKIEQILHDLEHAETIEVVKKHSEPLSSKEMAELMYRVLQKQCTVKK